MYETAINKICNSMFPVFYTIHRNGITTVGICGTAFFINDIGHFMTALQVTNDIPAGSKLMYAGNLPHSSLDRPIEIKEVYQNKLKFIYIGKVPESDLRGVNFSVDSSSIGASVCMGGYPVTDLPINTDDTVNLSTVRQYWQPTTVIDGIEAAINHGTRGGFVTLHSPLNGMNGGPVFNQEGLVCGMDITSFIREVPEPNGGKTFVRNGVVISTLNLRDLVPDHIPLS
ncbi:MAG: hypothetical protein RIG61_06540 [Deltaproteobacteria bacterium]